jgi:hypothetical protein
VKNTISLKIFGALALLGTGLAMTGCKTAPDLTQANAQALIQAKYDATPAVGVNITVNNDGMVQGATAKYWARTKVYPNRYWADFTLTPDGKKALKLPAGGDVIQWRPDSPTDKSFSVVVVPVAANHLRAREIKSIQDAIGGGKTVMYTESVDLTGVPDALQGIAHNPGNKLSTSRQADFVLDGGAWKLQSIE